MDSEEKVTQSVEPAATNRGREGCLLNGLLVLVVLGTAVSSIVFMVAGWSYEQVIFEGSLGAQDFRCSIMLGLGILQISFLLILLAIIKPSFSRAAYTTLLWAWIFFLIQFSTRLLPVTDSQAVMAAQSGLMSVYLLIYYLFRRLQPAELSFARSKNFYGAALGASFGLLAAIPWILAGALGSILDIILALVDSLLFGYCASLVLTQQFFLKIFSERNVPVKFREILGWGSISMVALLVMVSGVAQNGNQLALSLSVPVVGGGVLLVNRLGLPGKSISILPASLWVGLITAWPLLWFDPDELMVVVGMSRQDAAGLAGMAGLGGMLLTLMAVIVLVFLNNSRMNLPGLRQKLIAAWSFPVLIALLLAGGYYIFGNTGLHGERLFVILKNQEDVSSAAQVKDYHGRRAQVYTILVGHAETTQADLRSSLDRWGIKYKPYYLVNALEVDGGPLVRLWLLNRPEVDRVLDSPVLRPLPEALTAASGTAETPVGVDWNLSAIGADRVWEMGVTGKGIVVGQSDSGVQGDHPELADSYRGSKSDSDYNWYDPWNGTTAPVDIGGHGTHTLGTVLGNRVGVAPDAEWIGCVNLARNLGNPALYLECMQFMLAPFPFSGDPFRDGKPELGAQVLNNSWGCPPVEGCDSNVMLPAVKALRSAGIFVVVSAGNSGYKGCGSVDAPPAIYEEVFSVGSVNKELNLSQFSSLGPVDMDGSGRVKPDIVAPGDEVLSSYPNSTYEIASGTSMAGPHVVGVVALLWSASPSLVGDIDRTEEILRKTARKYEGSLPSCVISDSMPNNAVGYGIVDAFQAVKIAVLR